MNGIINVLKPPGMTSHDVVAKMRRITATRQCGHAGTLDPGAAGVLPVLVGRATRVSEYMLAMDKSYRAELTLGTATDTEDASGTVVARMPVPPLDKERVRNVLASFTGVINQVPPMYSALSVDGVRLYRLAREGRSVERKPRQVSIHTIELAELRQDTILFDLSCSRGTYVRTLCADIAKKLGACGHMSFLLRTGAGPFLLEESFTLEELSALAGAGRLSEAVVPADRSLFAFPALVLTPDQSRLITGGASIRSPRRFDHGQITRVYAPEGEFLALAEYREGLLHPKKVFLTGWSAGN
jgi:tRNA pseudouridine55 synthase